MILPKISNSNNKTRIASFSTICFHRIFSSRMATMRSLLASNNCCFCTQENIILSGCVHQKTKILAPLFSLIWRNLISKNWIWMYPSIPSISSSGEILTTMKLHGKSKAILNVNNCCITTNCFRRFLPKKRDLKCRRIRSIIKLFSTTCWKGIKRIAEKMHNWWINARKNCIIYIQVPKKSNNMEGMISLFTKITNF